MTPEQKAMTPEQKATPLNLPPLKASSVTLHARPPAPAATVVATAAVAASADPPLKSNQPIHSRAVPRKMLVALCGLNSTSTPTPPPRSGQLGALRRGRGENQAPSNRRTSIREATAEEKAKGKRGGARGDVHGPAAGKVEAADLARRVVRAKRVEAAEVADPAARGPVPVGNGVVDDRRPQEHKDDGRQDADALNGLRADQTRCV